MHNHDHSRRGNDRIATVFSLNLIFSIIEFIGGYLTGSTAIMADAIHDLGDSLSIGLAWVLDKISQREADTNFTYGYQRFSLFGALINSVILVAGSVWVLSEAIPRLWNPVMPIAEGMLALAVLGVTVNGYAAYKMSQGESLNERVLNWHLLEDALGWVAVLIVSIVLMFVHWPILDPILSIAFTLFILVNVGKTLWETLRIFAQSTPDTKLAENIERTLAAAPEVTRTHDLRLWSLDGVHHVMSVHLEMSTVLDGAEQLAFKRRLSETLAPFELAHTTVELEWPEEDCRHQ